MLSILAAAALSGSCSSQSKQIPAEVAGPLVLDFFSARGFLGGSEYERYHLENQVLWRECGSISRSPGRNRAKPIEGDDFLTQDPSLAIKQRRVEALTQSQESALRVQVHNLLSQISQNNSSAPPPGSVFSLGDPGLVEVSIRLGSSEKRIVTSVDAVADQQTEDLAKLGELFSFIRGFGPEICNSGTFFGIGRKRINSYAGL